MISLFSISVEEVLQLKSFLFAIHFYGRSRNFERFNWDFLKFKSVGIGKLYKLAAKLVYHYYIPKMPDIETSDSGGNKSLTVIKFMELVSFLFKIRDFLTIKRGLNIKYKFHYISFFFFLL